MDKSGKRNRFLDALAGRNVQEEPEKFPEIPLKDMVQTLEGVTEMYRKNQKSFRKFH